MWRAFGQSNGKLSRVERPSVIQGGQVTVQSGEILGKSGLHYEGIPTSIDSVETLLGRGDQRGRIAQHPVVHAYCDRVTGLAQMVVGGPGSVCAVRNYPSVILHRNVRCSIDLVHGDQVFQRSQPDRIISSNNSGQLILQEWLGKVDEPFACIGHGEISDGKVRSLQAIEVNRSINGHRGKALVLTFRYTSPIIPLMCPLNSEPYFPSGEK